MMTSIPFPNEYILIASIDIVGVPRAGGSKIAGIGSRSGRLFVRPASPLTAEWRSACSVAANVAFCGTLLTCPLHVEYIFLFPRPKSHFRTGKKASLLRLDAPVFVSCKPDLTKLVRSTEDAMTGIIWKDDAQVVSSTAHKRYCLSTESAGANVRIYKT